MIKRCYNFLFPITSQLVVRVVTMGKKLGGLEDFFNSKMKGNMEFIHIYTILLTTVYATIYLYIFVVS